MRRTCHPSTSGSRLRERACHRRNSPGLPCLEVQPLLCEPRAMMCQTRVLTKSPDLWNRANVARVVDVHEKSPLVSDDLLHKLDILVLGQRH